MATKEVKVLRSIAKPIVDAFIKDCQNILIEYEKISTYKYEPFAEIWKRRHFSMVFSGQKRLPELQVFVEMCFTIVKKFLFSERNTHFRAGAFYLLYGLYYKQPLREWIKIRLKMDEYKQLDELIGQMKTLKELEIVFAFAKMKYDSAFQYVVMDERMELQMKLFQKALLQVDERIFRREDVVWEVLDKIFGEESCLDELKVVNKKYLSSMKEFSNERPFEALTVFDCNIVNELEDSYKKIKERMEEIVASSSSYMECEEDELMEDVQKKSKRRYVTKKNKT